MGFPRANERLTHENIQWVKDYLEDHIQGISFAGVYDPEIRYMEFSSELQVLDTEALTINKFYPGFYRSNPKLSWIKNIPPGGLMIFRDDFDWSKSRWKGIIIHEFCHWLDYKTAVGCKCDSYSIMYVYYTEMGLFDKIGSWYGFKIHNPLRICLLKKEVLLKLNATIQK